MNLCSMPWAPTFGDVGPGQYLMYEDSYGRLCVAQNQGNAAQSLSVLEGTSVNVRRPAGPPKEDPARLVQRGY